MRLLMKLFTLPVLLLMKVLCLLGTIVTNLLGYVITLYLFVVVGCGIYCICTANWHSLAILVVMALARFALLVACVWFVVKAEGIWDSLGEFIRS